MWRWLQEKLPKRLGVLGKLWLISGSVHGLILLCALLIGATHSQQLLVVTGARRQSDARIVLLPMLKTVRGTQFDQPVRGTKLAANQQAKKPTPQPKKVIKPVPKKPVKVPDKKTSKTTLGKQPEDKKELAKKSKPAPKSVAKKPAQEKPKPKEEKDPVVAQAVHKEEVKPIPEEKITELAGDPLATQDVIYVGRDDLRAMQTQTVVYDALQKNWRPPSGIAQDTLCQIAFEVDKEGNACNIEMQQNSKVLIFDVAARTAILQAHFNPAAQGQKFTVAFKP